MKTEKILAEIERLQKIQKTNHPISKKWRDASSALQPLFVEMANRSRALPDMLDVLQQFEVQFGTAIDNDEEINGGDAVEFIAGYLLDVRAAIAKHNGAK